MAEPQPLSFEDLGGELRELIGRVVGLDIRGDKRNLIVHAEGEFGFLEASGDECSFRVGGGEPRENDGIRFEQASWIDVELNASRILQAVRVENDIGPKVELRVSIAGGTSVTVYGAMPPRDQWTGTHFDTR